MLFVAALACCYWRISQSNRVAKRFEGEEAAREERVEAKMVERIEEARRNIDDRDGQSSESEESCVESSEEESARKTLMRPSHGDLSQGKNLSDEEMELRTNSR